MAGFSTGYQSKKSYEPCLDHQISHCLKFLLEGDVPDIKADLGPVLDGDAVSAEELELLDLPISRIHLPTVHITRVEN